MRKTIINYVSILLCILNVFGAVFCPWYFFEGFENSTLYHWLDQCDTDLAVWGIAIIGVIIMVISAVCLTTSILMPYYYDDIYSFVENCVDRWFPRKPNTVKQEPKISVTTNDIPKPLPEPNVAIEDPIVKTTITDLEHVSEVIAGGEFDKTPKINNVVSGMYFVDNFDEYFPMTASNYYRWTYAIEEDCERIRKSMLKDDKTAYFYEKNPKDRENLLLGIQTTVGKWRINRDENSKTKWFDYCIYDYVEDKHYLLVDPVEVSMELQEKDWKNYISLYIELECLFDCSDHN
jgi:hypothetical protein